MTKYNALVDWISFTLPFSPAGEGGKLEDHERAVFNSMRRSLGEALPRMLVSGAGFMHRGRAPYTMGWRNGAVGVAIWAAEATAHMTIEFSGKGCDWLRENGRLFPLLEVVAGRMTRIDIALDIECDVDPVFFTDAREPGRFKTESVMVSQSGTTCYVGSMKSERYARVYRYKSPHPRGHLLRVEHVFRREQAKAVAHTLLHFGIEAVAQSAVDVFGWKHAVTPRDFGQIVPLSAERPERGGGSTIRWLLTQVAPAFQRLVLDGTISDPETFLKDYFLPAVSGDSED